MWFVLELILLRLDVELRNLKKKVTHLIELVCAFRDRPTRFEAGNKLGKGVEIHCIGLLDGIAKDDNEAMIASAIAMDVRKTVDPTV